MTNAWTKGPWTICYDGQIDAAGEYVCHFRWASFKEFNEENNAANARLIAAAPDMAEALEDILPLVGWTNLSDDELRLEADAGNENAPLILKARAALARARGTP